MQPIGPITETFRTIDYIEAGLWSVMGVGFAIQALRPGARPRCTCALAAIALLAFGASDLVEAQTGAWWHPWWLFVWKGACVIAFGAMVVRYTSNPLRRGR